MVMSQLERAQQANLGLCNCNSEQRIGHESTDWIHSVAPLRSSCLNAGPTL